MAGHFDPPSKKAADRDRQQWAGFKSVPERTERPSGRAGAGETWIRVLLQSRCTEERKHVRARTRHTARGAASAAE